MQSDEALQLLRDNHVFPGPFRFRAILSPAVRGAVLAAVEAAGVGAIELVEERESAAGRFLALHVTVRIARAEDVLAVWAAIREVEGVRLVL